jgi:uncharacterized protein YukE
MADITVEPAALRAAATRIEQALAAIDAVRGALAGAALDIPSAATGLLQRGYGDLHADQQATLRALSDSLGDDADGLRRAADRYEETECRNTIATP